jgi:hypothetical protein
VPVNTVTRPSTHSLVQILSPAQWRNETDTCLQVHTRRAQQFDTTALIHPLSLISQHPLVVSSLPCSTRPRKQWCREGKRNCGTLLTITKTFSQINIYNIHCWPLRSCWQVLTLGHTVCDAVLTCRQVTDVQEEPTASVLTTVWHFKDNKLRHRA